MRLGLRPLAALAPEPARAGVPGAEAPTPLPLRRTAPATRLPVAVMVRSSGVRDPMSSRHASTSATVHRSRMRAGTALGMRRAASATEAMPAGARLDPALPPLPPLPVLLLLLLARAEPADALAPPSDPRASTVAIERPIAAPPTVCARKEAASTGDRPSIVVAPRASTSPRPERGSRTSELSKPGTAADDGRAINSSASSWLPLSSSLPLPRRARLTAPAT